ncbi:MAG: cellobiose phosphorylase, partial [Anaerolineae bacterium]
LLKPEVGEFNVLSFLGLVQADGYNPLVVEGSRFSLAPERRAAVLALVERPERLAPLLARPFTPGGLLRAIADGHIGLKVRAEEFIASTVAHAEQHFEATFGEGYWIDHWIYNLDQIETYLAIYPDRKEDLLFGRPIVPYFDSPAVVPPRARKYVLAGEGRVRQYGTVVEDEEKAALIADRTEFPNLVRTAHGTGEVYRTTVFAKLVGLALLKFATLDPLGMGVEMEAGRPGWYDALNGLPGLFGSSLCETYELDRLLTFLLEAMAENGVGAVELTIEQAQLMERVVEALQLWCDSDDPGRDFCYWDIVTTAREAYRASVRSGFDGETKVVSFEELMLVFSAFQAKVRAGIQRAVEMNQRVSPRIPPTYFAYTVTDYEPIADAHGEPLCDAQGRPYVRAKQFEPTVLPLFLEGPVHALKVQPDVASARELYAKIRTSNLYDHKLGMYKVNASLKDQPHEIGRARSFPAGWLENESVWLHMEYKYLLEVLKAGLYEEFFEDFKAAVVCFHAPAVYGR